jgi:hypothetical protein
LVPPNDQVDVMPAHSEAVRFHGPPARREEAESNLLALEPQDVTFVFPLRDWDKAVSCAHGPSYPTLLDREHQRAAGRHRKLRHLSRLIFSVSVLTGIQTKLVSGTHILYAAGAPVETPDTTGSSEAEEVT